MLTYKGGIFGRDDVSDDWTPLHKPNMHHYTLQCTVEPETKVIRVGGFIYIVETQALWRTMSLSSFLPSFLVSLACSASNLAFSIGYSVRLPVIVISLNVIGYKPILYFDF